ncbi:peptidoglycan-binding protein LysM [Shinella yambaruensis]|uniref:Peptidoglycan-binding protein LysM n=1 Tax=Shinella yambaruensis TaxID=415996 RepID=A0ABQ5ZJ85_9HYPH|nr:peptidoglycan-binding protein LysM [Shinella yambaruensis]MCJ8029503.1 peptidoglycan-binding protein LysM [Shinella yambaruensis]MCU7983591.1 peptidoglycan-binding protein LysM [Shinella yambaruensis]GLR50707.1 peptidoglycan-binding protein LysM [Shinella yambaruensis]
MGLFSFIKTAGKKLGIGGDDEAPEAAAVKKELDSFDLGTQNVEVSVEGDKCVLKGVVADQTAFEKAVIAVGNTLGISRVEAADLKVVPADSGLKPGQADMTALVEAAAPAQAPTLYTVKKGDNLWKIAESHYGKGKGARHMLIFDANRPMLSHPDKIYPGQVLRIPDLAEA